jgi:hypothetical protein
MSALLFSACSRFQSKPAGIQVNSNIPAAINLDGKDVGDTSYQADKLPIKKSTLKLTPADSTLAPYETSIRLFGGFVTQVDWNFGTTTDENSGFIFEYEEARNKSNAELQLTAVPDNVPVSVDGKNAGFTPLLLDSLDEGNHEIKFQAPGYADATRTVKLVKGTRTLMTTKLAKLPVAPTPTPVATESAVLGEATASAKTATPKPSVKPSATPKTASGAAATPAASASAAVKKTTTQKPYVEVLTTETGFLRVREAPVSGAELFKLAIGSTVPYASASSSGWLKVTYDGTKTGWVSGQYSKLVQ